MIFVCIHPPDPDMMTSIRFVGLQKQSLSNQTSSKLLTVFITTFPPLAVNLNSKSFNKNAELSGRKVPLGLGG